MATRPRSERWSMAVPRTLRRPPAGVKAGCAGSDPRQLDDDRKATAARAVGEADGAAVKVGDPLDDREPEPGARLSAAGDAMKALAKPLALGRRDARALVGHGQSDHRPIAGDVD